MQGGIIDKDMPIHVSAVAHRLLEATARPGSATASTSDGKKIRVCRKCGGDAVSHRHAAHRAAPPARPRYDSEIRGQLKDEPRPPQRHAGAAPREDRHQHGRRAAPPSSSRCSTARCSDLTIITGQKPLVTRAKKSIASFKLREGNAIGAMVTLRGDRMWEFFDRLDQPRDPAHPGLPGPVADSVRRPGQLHLRRHRAAHLSGDRLRPDRLGPGHGHHDRDDRRNRRRRPSPARRLRLPVPT